MELERTAPGEVAIRLVPPVAMLGPEGDAVARFEDEQVLVIRAPETVLSQLREEIALCEGELTVAALEAPEHPAGLVPAGGCLVVDRAGLLVGVQDDTEDGIATLFVDGEQLPGGWCRDDPSYWLLPRGGLPVRPGQVIAWREVVEGGVSLDFDDALTLQVQASEMAAALA